MMIALVEQDNQHSTTHAWCTFASFTIHESAICNLCASHGCCQISLHAWLIPGSKFSTFKSQEYSTFFKSFFLFKKLPVLEQTQSRLIGFESNPLNNSVRSTDGSKWRSDDCDTKETYERARHSTSENQHCPYTTIRALKNRWWSSLIQ